ncbi:hypothetical protein MHUMG1_08593 [Metarhizium humberi]|uniref:Uncharacterized protein n=1 Tax=Metarhizium humberi TaxID=2596975 RepID=A0A9P8M5A1_9HYPO|nr:hypothetical protein MHUMG1_08593 [Metarhizium humberi]
MSNLANVGNIVRTLQSVNSNVTEDGQLCLLSLEGDRLIENIYDNEELLSQRCVTNDAKHNSSAVYMMLESSAFMLYLGSNASLCAREFNHGEKEWVEAKIEIPHLTDLCPETRLSVVTVPEVTIVFYQTIKGQVHGIAFDRKKEHWLAPFCLPCQAQRGTPISAFSTQESVIVSFVDIEKKVHIFSRRLEADKWEDKILDDSSDNAHMMNLVVYENEERGTIEAFAQVQNKILHIDQHQGRSCLGQVTKGEFTPITKAECGRFIRARFGMLGRLRGNTNITINSNNNSGYAPISVWGARRPAWA